MESVQGVLWVAVLILFKQLETTKPVGGERSKGYIWRDDQQLAVLCPDWDTSVEVRVELSGSATGGTWFKSEIVFI